MFSCKFAEYFQNTFSKEHLWVAASDITYVKGSKIDFIITNEINQIINVPIYVMKTSSSSCIDLIFVSQLNLLTE